MMIRLGNNNDYDSYKEIRAECLPDFEILAGKKLLLKEEDLKLEFKQALSKRGVLLIALDGNKITGLLTGLMKSRSKACLTDILVKHAYRLKGCAEELMNAFEALMKGRNVTTLMLGVRINNKSAIQLYKKHGYKITNKDSHSYSMEKIL